MEPRESTDGEGEAEEEPAGAGLEPRPAPIEGWLWKRSRRVKVWRRRQVVLADGILAFYRPSSSKRHSSPTLRARFQLTSECRVERAPDSHRDLHCFVLITGPSPDQRTHIGAETSSEASRWVLKLSGCCRDPVDGPPRPISMGNGKGPLSFARGGVAALRLRPAVTPSKPRRAGTAAAPAAAAAAATGAAHDAPSAPAESPAFTPLASDLSFDAAIAIELRSRPSLHSAVLRALAANSQGLSDRWRLSAWRPRGCPRDARIWREARVEDEPPPRAACRRARCILG